MFFSLVISCYMYLALICSSFLYFHFLFSFLFCVVVSLCFFPLLHCIRFLLPRHHVFPCVSFILGFHCFPCFGYVHEPPFSNGRSYTRTTVLGIQTTSTKRTMRFVSWLGSLLYCYIKVLSSLMCCCSLCCHLIFID